MRAALIVVGIIAQMVAWWRISSGRVTVWQLMPFVLGAMGIAALLLMPPPQRTTGVGAALAVGIGAGFVLFLGTRVFVALASLWGPFAHHVEEAYREAAEEPVRAALVLSLLISVPAGGAAVAVLVLYVLGNVPSRSLPIVAGAVVGGAVWGALAWWSGGLAAPLASHILWTGLMLLLPPKVGREVAA